MADNEKAIILYFDRALTDDELRQWHDAIPDQLAEARDMKSFEKLREAVAKQIARSLGDDFDKIPASKREWVQHQGMFDGRARHVSEPYTGDYRDAAYDALMLLSNYGIDVKRICAGELKVLGKEPTEAMKRAATALAPTWNDHASQIKWQAMWDAAP